MLNIFVNSPDDLIHNIQISESISIAQLKKQLCEKLKKDASESQKDIFARITRLLYNKRQLCNDFSVSEYKIKNFDTIYIKSSLLAGADTIQLYVHASRDEDPCEITVRSD